MARFLNHRLAKVHRTYTVEEIATRWGVHRNTVRRWLGEGLPAIDEKRPLLIHGADLAAFLKARRQRNRRPCLPGQIYCVRCREPRYPAGGMADYQPLTTRLGNIVGLCPICHCLMFRRVNLDKLHQVRGGLDVRRTEFLPHIVESVSLSVSSDFRTPGEDDGAPTQS